LTPTKRRELIITARPRLLGSTNIPVSLRSFPRFKDCFLRWPPSHALLWMASSFRSQADNTMPRYILSRINPPNSEKKSKYPGVSPLFWDHSATISRQSPDDFIHTIELPPRGYNRRFFRSLPASQWVRTGPLEWTRLPAGLQR